MSGSQHLSTFLLRNELERTIQCLRGKAPSPRVVSQTNDVIMSCHISLASHGPVSAPPPRFPFHNFKELEFLSRILTTKNKMSTNHKGSKRPAEFFHHVEIGFLTKQLAGADLVRRIVSSPPFYPLPPGRPKLPRGMPEERLPGDKTMIAPCCGYACSTPSATMLQRTGRNTAIVTRSLAIRLSKDVEVARALVGVF